MADQNVATSAETESPEKLRQQLVELQQQYTKVTQQLAHYQRIAELAPSVLYIYDLVGQQNIYANHELTDLLGYSVEEVQRMGEALFVTLLHPDDLSIIIEHHQRLAGAADNEILELRYRMRHANGDWHWRVVRSFLLVMPQERQFKN
jgi:PAS domain S-box-containing protein